MNVSRKNILIGVVVALCFAMSLISLVFTITGFGNSDVTNNVMNNPLIVTAQDTQEISLCMSGATVASDGSTTQDITASVNSDATLKKVNWSIAFKNSTSEWATGKNVSDYVTIARTGDLSATITCLQAFGEQIIITATAADNGGAKATATVDYVKRINNIYFSVNENTSYEDCVFISNTIYGNNDINDVSELMVDFGIGTITPEMRFIDEDSYFSLYISDQGEFASGYERIVESYNGFGLLNYEKYDNTVIVRMPVTAFFDFLADGKLDINDMIPTPTTDDGERQYQDVHEFLSNYFGLLGGCQDTSIDGEIYYDVYVNDGLWQSNYLITVYLSTYYNSTTLANSVTISNPSIIF